LFVPPESKRVKPPIGWRQFIPENLRNFQEPEWMVERDAKRASEAAIIPPPTKEELWQEVFRRNKAAYRPSVDLPTKQHLLLELANNHMTCGTRLARDVAPDPSLLSHTTTCQQSGSEQAVGLCLLAWHWMGKNPQIPAEKMKQA
jgi:hypothetical protein